MSERDPFIPEHNPLDFKDPIPLQCPQDHGKDSCPYLHCIACHYKLAYSGHSYSCFKCDAVYILDEKDSIKKCKQCKGKGRGGHKGCEWICPDCNGTGKYID